MGYAGSTIQYNILICLIVGCSDCVMASSAAPIYFPSYKGQIDAAVMCNDPALAAVSVVMGDRALHQKRSDQVHVLSFGTGMSFSLAPSLQWRPMGLRLIVSLHHSCYKLSGKLSQFIDGTTHDWGMFKWMPHIPQLMVLKIVVCGVWCVVCGVWCVVCYVCM